MHKRNASDKLKLSSDKLLANTKGFISEPPIEKKLNKNMNGQTFLNDFKEHKDYKEAKRDKSADRSHIKEQPKIETQRLQERLNSSLKKNTSSNSIQGINSKQANNQKQINKGSSKDNISKELILSNTAKIVSNLKDKFFKHSSEQEDLKNNEVIQVLKEKIEKKYRSEIDMKNQMIGHLEKKVKKLENDIIEYINRVSNEGIRNQKANEDLRSVEERAKEREKDLQNKVRYLEEELNIIRDDRKGLSKDKHGLKNDFDTLKLKYDDLLISNQKKDNLIDLFLFFLNNIQMFLKNHRNYDDFNLYTLKGALNTDSTEFKNKLVIIETYLCNVSNDIETNGLDLVNKRKVIDSMSERGSARGKQNRSKSPQNPYTSPVKKDNRDFRVSENRDKLNIIDHHKILEIAKEKEFEREKEWLLQKEKYIKEKYYELQHEIREPKDGNRESSNFQNQRDFRDSYGSLRYNDLMKSSGSIISDKERENDQENNRINSVTSTEEFYKVKSELAKIGKIESFGQSGSSSRDDRNLRSGNENSVNNINTKSDYNLNLRDNLDAEMRNQENLRLKNQLRREEYEKRLLEEQLRKAERDKEFQKLEKDKIADAELDSQIERLREKHKKYSEDLEKKNNAKKEADEGNIYSFREKQEISQDENREKYHFQDQYSSKAKGQISNYDLKSSMNSIAVNSNHEGEEILDLKDRVLNLEEQLFKMKIDKSKLSSNSRNNSIAKKQDQSIERVKGANVKQSNDSFRSSNKSKSQQKFNNSNISSNSLNKSKLNKSISNSVERKKTPSKKSSSPHCHRKSPLHVKHECEIHNEEYFYGSKIDQQ